MAARPARAGRRLDAWREAAGYAGFLLFVLRVPNNKTEPRWRGVERALPLVGLVFALLLFASYGACSAIPPRR